MPLERLEHSEQLEPLRREQMMDPMIAICLAVVAAMAIGFVVVKRKRA